ncbi:MAG: hypothetical protein JWN15_226 [Firmicutes bacterium]|nr:hypothetical protein [Bacillota bacterium]
MKHNRKAYRRVRMSKEMIQMLEEQKQRFRAKFGRDPRPDDPVVWDEDADQPTPVSEEDIHEVLLQALTAASSPPEFIFAFRKTGRLVTESNQHLLSPEEYQEWCDAVEEYRRLN